VVIHTSLIELLTPAETQAVIAHELGHLKCDHSLYLTLANLITLAANLLPGGEVMAQSLQSQIMEWVRCAEFTCDRAALLVAQDPRVVASLLMKLSGGSPSLVSQLNLDAFSGSGPVLRSHQRRCVGRSPEADSHPGSDPSGTGAAGQGNRPLGQQPGLF
jgi:Zn-dependent protease with chaperone function